MTMTEIRICKHLDCETEITSGSRNKSGYCRRHKHHGVRNQSQCRIDGCDKLNYVGDLCSSHYLRLRKYGDPFGGSKGAQGSATLKISGPLPKDNEVSIYALYDDSGEVFYVGSTKEPTDRIYSYDWDFPFTMAIIKNVAPEDVVYWESKMIVEYWEAGYKLMNSRTPHKRGLT